VQALELVADVGPGVTDGELRDPQQEQRQPAQLHVRLAALVVVVEHRAEVDLDGLEVTPAALGLVQGLVGVGDVLGVRRSSAVPSRSLPW
jgi:hypothetical protein